MMKKEQKLIEVRDRQYVTDNNEISEVGQVIKEAMRLLRPKYREPIALRYYDNLSYEQISNILGISQTAVNGRILRGKRKIAKYLIHKGIAGAGYGNA
jgi:RNA polymerase sigma factor (sigma-70 family)